MQFVGVALLRILQKQKEPIMLCDAAGVPVPNKIDASAAVELGLTSGFVGIGNKKRIRYLQATNPRVGGCGWRGGSHTTRPVRADGSCAAHAAGQLLGNARCLREHIPSPGPTSRPKFASCPPVGVPENQVRGIADFLRLNRKPDGVPASAKPARTDRFPRVPISSPIDTQKLNGPINWE